MSSIRHKFVLALKRLIYGKRGEPYAIVGRSLRYIPGTRPVRMSYVSSSNDNNRYDVLQIRLLAEHLREGDTAIDIGAHCGQYCILMAAMCGAAGTVVAFEPDHHARKILMQNLDLNSGIKRPMVEALAVSDTQGEAVLYSRGGNSQSSLARSGIGETAARDDEIIVVPLVTLDAYVREKGLHQPRWVKIDAEGAEIRILKGAPKLLAGDTEIVCELHPYAWAGFGNSFEELKALVRNAGRRMRYLDEHSEIGSDAKYGVVLLERIA